LPDDLEGFVPQSQLPLPPGKAAEQVTKEGQGVALKVLEVDPIHHRIILAATEFMEMPEPAEPPAKSAAETDDAATDEAADESAEVSAEQDNQVEASVEEKVDEAEEAEAEEAEKAAD